MLMRWPGQDRERRACGSAPWPRSCSRRLPLRFEVPARLRCWHWTASVRGRSGKTNHEGVAKHHGWAWGGSNDRKDASSEASGCWTVPPPATGSGVGISGRGLPRQRTTPTIPRNTRSALRRMRTRCRAGCAGGRDRARRSCRGPRYPCACREGVGTGSPGVRNGRLFEEPRTHARGAPGDAPSMVAVDQGACTHAARECSE